MADSEDVPPVADVSLQLNQLNVNEESSLEELKKAIKDAHSMVEELNEDNRTLLEKKTETELKLEWFRTEYEKLHLKYETTCLRHYDENRQKEHEFQKIKKKLMEEVEFLEKTNTELEEEAGKAKEEARRLGGMVSEMVPKICVAETEEEWLNAANDLLENNIRLRMQVDTVERANEDVKLENQKVKEEGENLKKFLREKYGSEFRSLNRRNMELTKQCEAMTEKTSKCVEGMKTLFEDSMKKLANLETVLADPATAESHSQWSQRMTGLVAKCHAVFSVPYCKLCGAEYNEQKIAKMLGCGHSICDSCARELIRKKKSISCPFDRKKTKVESGKACDLATNFDLMEALEVRFGGEERVVVEVVESDDDGDNDNENDEVKEE